MKNEIHKIIIQDEKKYIAFFVHDNYLHLFAFFNEINCQNIFVLYYLF